MHLEYLYIKIRINDFQFYKFSNDSMSAGGGSVARAQGEPPGDPTRCQPITPLDSPLVLFFVAVSHGVIGEDSLMESSDI